MLAQCAQPSRRDVLLELAHAGLRAPSGDNLQPWRVRLRDTGFDLCFEPPGGILDVGHVASRIAAGAFAENVRLAATARRLAAHVTFDPDAGDPRIWARIELVAARGSVDELASVIFERHTNRENFDGSPLEAAAADALRAEVLAPNRLHLLCDRRSIRRVARLVGAAERVRAEIRAAHEELHAALRWTPAEVEWTRDGLDVRTLGIRRDQRFFLRLLRPWRRQRVANRLGASRSFGAHAANLARSASALGVLTVPSLDPGALCALGQTMQRVWLRATWLGLAFSPLAALPLLSLRIEHHGGEGLSRDAIDTIHATGAALRERFGLAAGEHPLFLFRVGRARPPEIRSLRRHAEEIAR